MNVCMYSLVPKKTILDYFQVNRRNGNQEYFMGCASFNEKFKSVEIFKGCDTRLQCFLEI